MTALRSGTIDTAIVTGVATQKDDETLPLWRERIMLARYRKIIHWPTGKPSIGLTSVAKRFCSVNVTKHASLRIF
jgi:hypothetical protein